MDNMARLRWAILGTLIAVALASSLVAVLLGGQEWDALLLNLGTEMAGAAATYGLLELVIGRRERQEAEESVLEAKKRGLIAQMGSSVRDTAVSAAEELWRHGWLHDGSLQLAYLRGANLSEANLEGADLERAILSRADLEGANLFRARLRRAGLYGANLSGANLSGAILRGAYLSGAYLSGAILREANLIDAELHGANLTKARLRGAWLSEAKLFGANLSGADLRGATVTDEQLAQAKSLKGATMPDGTKHD